MENILNLIRSKRPYPFNSAANEPIDYVCGCVDDVCVVVLVMCVVVLMMCVVVLMMCVWLC